jgi:hypothetical protein
MQSLLGPEAVADVIEAGGAVELTGLGQSLEGVEGPGLTVGSASR